MRLSTPIAPNHTAHKTIDTSDFTDSLLCIIPYLQPLKLLDIVDHVGPEFGFQKLSSDHPALQFGSNPGAEKSMSVPNQVREIQISDFQNEMSAGPTLK